jgi:hypothetical protein
LKVTAPVKSTNANAPTSPCRRKARLLAQALAKTVRKRGGVSGILMPVMFDLPRFLTLFGESPQTSKIRAKSERSARHAFPGGNDGNLPILPSDLPFS